MVPPSLLHMQHRLITMARLFLKFSKVRIFPSAAIQTKNAALGVAYYSRWTDFYGKLASIIVRDQCIIKT